METFLIRLDMVIGGRGWASVHPSYQGWGRRRGKSCEFKWERRSGSFSFLDLFWVFWIFLRIPLTRHFVVMSVFVETWGYVQHGVSDRLG